MDVFVRIIGLSRAIIPKLDQNLPVLLRSLKKTVTLRLNPSMT